MKWLILVCRILLGLMFTMFGLNGLHDFMHMSAHMPAPGTPVGDWDIIMMSSGWMKGIAIIELLGGVATLAGAVPLGLCLLCPVLVNILFFHLFMPGAGGGQIFPGIGCTALAFVLIYGYRDSFAGIFDLKAKPTG